MRITCTLDTHSATFATFVRNLGPGQTSQRPSGQPGRDSRGTPPANNHNNPDLIQKLYLVLT